MNWRFVIIGLIVGTGIWLADSLIFSVLGLFFFTTLFEFLGEISLLIALVAVYLYGRRSGVPTAVTALAAVLAGFSLIPSIWTLSTTRQVAVEVVFAGTDEERGGARTAFVADLRAADGDLMEVRARDVFYPPFYWNVWSGAVRSELRAALHDKRPVCVTLTGVRLPWYFPNVLEVDGISNCSNGGANGDLG